MALKPCRECGAQVSSNAKSCPQCGVAHPVRSLGGDVNSCGGCLLVVVGFVIVATIMSTIGDSVDSRQKARAARAAETREAARKDSVATFFQIHRDSILGAARTLMASGALDDAMSSLEPYWAARLEGLTPLRDSIREMQLLAELRAVPASDLEGNASRYSELNVLRPENATYQSRAASYGERRDRARAAAEATRMVEARRDYARRLESGLLDKWMNVRVRTRGTDARVLVLEYVLVDRTWAHNMSKDASMFAALRRLGFTRFEITDGYNQSWYWDFK